MVRPYIGALIAAAGLLSSPQAHADADYLLRRERGGLWLVGPDGARVADLLPRLLVDSRSGGRTRRSRLRFSVDQQGRRGTGLTAEVAARHARYRLRIELAQQSTIRMTLRIEHRQRATLHRETLRFHTAPLVDARLLDRAYREVSIRRQHFVGALTPKQLTLSTGGAGVALASVDGERGVVVTPIRAGALRIDVELESQRSRPFLVYRACGPTRGADHSKSERGRRLGRRRIWSQQPASGQREIEMTWVLGRPRLAQVMRFPRGYRAAISLTDHADESSSATLEALAFGATGAIAAGKIGADHPGLVNRGLAYTKTVFLARSSGYPASLTRSPTGG